MSLTTSRSPYTKSSILSTPEWIKTPILDQITDQIVRLVNQAKPEKPVYELIARILSNQDFCKKDLERYLSLYSSVVVRIPTVTFTLSHLAGLTGNIKLAVLLAKMGEFTNDTICNGASPLHLAALKGHLNFLKHAELFVGDLSRRSQSNLTPLDVYEIIYPQHARHCHHSSIPKTIPYFERDGSIQLVQNDENQGFIYTDHICLNAATVEHDLIHNTEKIHAFPAPRIGLHPSLALVRLNILYPDCPTDLGLGVIAIANLPSDEFLGRYSGILWHSHGASHHSLDGSSGPGFITDRGLEVTNVAIDALDAGNLISRLGDGFPNVRGTTDEHGLYALKTHERIPCGSLLLWNYGPNHPVKLGSYIHFGEERLNQFFEDLPDLIKEINKIPPSKMLTKLRKSKIKAFIEKLDYIFSTPQLLWDAFLTNRLNLETFNGEFLTRLNRIVKPLELEYIIEKIALLYVVLTRVETKKKRTILLQHLKALSHISFKEAQSFLDNCDTTLPPSVYHMSAEEFSLTLIAE